VTDAPPRHDLVERNPPLAGFNQVDHSQGEPLFAHSQLLCSRMTANPLDLRSWLEEIRESAN